MTAPSPPNRTTGTAPHSRAAIALVALLASGQLACGGAPRFPLREPLWKDDDQRPFSPAPKEYVSPFVWDGANQMVFRPISRFFAVDPARRAINVNAFDEIPDSSWFTNRIGRAPMTAEEVIAGPCDGKVLDPNAPDGSWPIDQGKPNGANPGFRVNVPGLGKFMLKTDPREEHDRPTGATAIASRLYHAAGYFAPCDTVVYLRPSILKLKPGLTVTDNSGITRPFDQAALDKILAAASRRDGLVRMVASKWLPGKTIGPYTYDGKRDDDPNDVIDHEDRRELRGGRVLAAWLNHFDTREQNTMDVFMQLDPKAKESPGYVRHYIIDLGDCFGSGWEWDEMRRLLGFAYYLDFGYVAEDFITFGAIERPWERLEDTSPVFHYFSERDFVPEDWRGGYPNPAFTRMTEGDGAWMARILARFTDDLVGAAVSVGQYDAQATQELTRILIARRNIIFERYLTRLSPIADLRTEGDRLCGVDLARRTKIVTDAPFGARVYRGSAYRREGEPPVRPAADGAFCVDLPHVAVDAGVREDDPARYTVVDVWNGQAKGVLRAHLYDLGPQRGFRLVGIERPDDASPPG